MEGEKKYNIPLDAPLDINSNDMLVPASSPKFSFNRQRLLGSVLQNSVRYEADGWFASWYVHNFDLVSTGTVTIDPDTLGFPSLQDRYIPGQREYKYWTVKFTDATLQFSFNLEPYIVWLAGSGSFVRIDDQIVRITGSTSLGNNFTVDVNAYTGNIVPGTFVCDDPDFEATVSFSNGVFNLDVVKPYNLAANMIYLRFGDNALINDENFVYTYDGTTHKWGDFLKVNNNVDGLDLIASDTYALESSTVVSKDTINEYFEAVLRSMGTFTLLQEVQGTLVGGHDAFSLIMRAASNDEPWVDDNAMGTEYRSRDNVNAENPFMLAVHAPGAAALPIGTIYDSWIIGGWRFPIWMKLGQKFDIKFQIDIFERYILPPGSGGSINSYYMCILYMYVSRKEKEQSIQRTITDFGVEWTFTVNGMTYSENDVPETGALKIQLTDKTDSRVLQTVWPITLSALNKEGDTQFPLPLNYLYAAIRFNATIRKPTWTELPSPPPKWSPPYKTYPTESAIEYPGLWDFIYPDNNPPSDWKNPVDYPISWPSMPTNWLNPATYPSLYNSWPNKPVSWLNPVGAEGSLAWPPKPSDWANPVVQGSIAWPTTPPAGWTGTGVNAWASWITTHEVGTYIAPADWYSIADTYANFIAPLKPTNWPLTLGWPLAATETWEPPYNPAGWGWAFGREISSTQADGRWFSATDVNDYQLPYKPANWPINMSFPLAAGVDWNPPWPPNWPFGIPGLPANEWFSSVVSYQGYLSTNRPVNWPVTMEWPIVTVTPGWVPRTPNTWDGVVNTVGPASWTRPPWPPQWPFGVANLPANEWFIATQNYSDWVQQYKDPDWPIPWADPIHLVWPMVPEAGWVPRTGGNPYANPGWVVNPNQPAEWTPDWPIHWPFPITNEPPAWYSTSVSYIDWVMVHYPYQDVAADWATGGDPGYAWPNQPPVNWPMPTWNWPSTPTNFIDTYDPATGYITFIETMPADWPYYVTMDVLSKAEVVALVIGPDVVTPGWPITGGYDYVVLNRRALFFEDKHLFWADSETVFQLTTRLNAIFPICTYGHIIYKLSTVDITKCLNGQISVDAFEIISLANNDSSLPHALNLFRLDDNAKSGAYTKFSLSAVFPYIMGAQNPLTLAFSHMPVDCNVYISFNNLINLEFDKVTDYRWPGFNVSDNPIITDLQGTVPKQYLLAYGFYPEWIVPSYGGSTYWKVYRDFSSRTNTTYHNAPVRIWYYTWLDGRISKKVTYTPGNALNQKHAATLEQSTFETIKPAGYEHPWRPGLFTQQLLTVFDVPNQCKLTVNYNVFLKTSTFTWDPEPPLPWGTDWVSPAVDPYTVVFNHTAGSMTTADKHELIITLKRSDVYTVQLRRALLLSKAGLMNPATIAAADQNNISLTPSEFGSVDRDGAWTGYASIYKLLKSDVTKNTVALYVTRLNEAVAKYIPQGIFQYNEVVKYISVTRVTGGSQLVFEYKGTIYTLFIGDGTSTELKFNVTDIRDNTTREVASLAIAPIFMAIKQFWSSNVDVENFWWVDKNHVLALTKSELILYEKTELLDDWNGDRWRVIKRGKRGTFFNNEDLYYSVSSAFYGLPVLFKIQNKSSSDKTFQNGYFAGVAHIFFIKDILNMDFDNPQWMSQNQILWRCIVPPEKTGTQFGGTKYLDTLVPVDVNAVLCSGKISSTVLFGKYFFIGFALTRGLQQWTVAFDLETYAITRVIQGYGHVGHDATLTGGQIPRDYYTDNGFQGMVYDLKDFRDFDPDDNDILTADNKAFVSGASVWFVHTELKWLVSHMKWWKEDIFRPETIPLENNYSYKLERSSHKSAFLVDIIPRTLAVIDFLQAAGDTTAINVALSFFNAIAMPALWFIQPILCSAVLAAQGMHQSAYVIRNALPIKSEDGKSDKDVAVVRHETVVETVLDLGKFPGMVAFMLGLIGTVLNSTNSDDLKINAGTDSNTIADTMGRKLGQFVTRATLDSIGTVLTTRGLVMSVKTKSTEILALSMFYSINDGAQCWAGPGFVNHNFIGQAISQGVAASRFKLDRFGAYFPLQFITELLMVGQKKKAKELSDTFHDMFDEAGGGTSGGVVVEFPTTFLLALIGQIAVEGIDGLIVLYDALEKAIPALYQILGASARGFYSGGIERNTIEPEATHTYGNKPMSMFWPAFETGSNKLTVERVMSNVDWDPIKINVGGLLGWKQVTNKTTTADSNNNVNYNNNFFAGGLETDTQGNPFSGKLYLPSTSMKATNGSYYLPFRMALVEGIVNMLPSDSALKNLQVNCCDYTFPAPPIHDYIISEVYSIGVQAANGEIIAYSMDDTKLIDGPASNIMELSDFFGIASSYTAIEVKRGIDMDYLRPWAITPTCIALNINGINCVHNAKAYHGFDGQFNRITSWKGGNGLDSATLVQQYCFPVNDHFKRSNIIPPSEFFGLFDGPPSISMKSFGQDKIANQIMDLTRQKGLDINIPGEDRDLTRYAVPVHSEMLSTLPAVVRMLAPYKLHVVEGITSLTTDVRNTQTKYKAPSSVDFNLYDTMYRATEEYIALLTLQDGIVAVQDKTPSAGLEFIGATTDQAFFYSPATRMYYSFSNGGSIKKQDIFNRFKNIKNGRWDFVNQEVVFKCLLTDNLFENDVTGNIVARLDDRNVIGEVYPPNETIYNERSDFKMISMAGGFIYQGPKRCVVNRWVITDDMVSMIQSNKRKWQKLDREEWAPGRDYGWKYADWHTEATPGAVHGWTHNPWRAATAMLGESEETDCLFEWELTFAWTEQIDKIFEQNEFVSFNVAGETIGQGGTVLSRPTHIFLYKEHFKNGYYSMRYNSKNGVGNRERLYMWGDGMTAIESLSLYVKEVTTRRAQPIATSQVDVQELHEQ
jgi:hypothetical protein